MRKVKSLLFNLFILTLSVQAVNEFSPILEYPGFYSLLVMDIDDIDVEEDMEESSENENSEKEDYVVRTELLSKEEIPEKLCTMNSQARDGLFNLFDKTPMLRPPKV